MSKLLLSIFCFAMLSFSGFSQEDLKKSVFYQPASGQLADITIPVQGYDPNIIGALKDDLIRFEDKVTEVQFDEKNKELRLIYNEFMLIDDLEKLFDKYQVKHGKSTAPVSPIKHGQFR